MNGTLLATVGKDSNIRQHAAPMDQTQPPHRGGVARLPGGLLRVDPRTTLLRTAIAVTTSSSIAAANAMRPLAAKAAVATRPVPPTSHKYELNRPRNNRDTSGTSSGTNRKGIEAIEK